MYKLQNWGFLQNGDFFPLNNDYILVDSGDFFYPMAQIFMRTIQKSSFVEMLTCSDEVHPSTALFYTDRFPTTAANGGKHPPDWNTTAQYASISSLENPHFVQQNTGTMAVDKAKFSPCIGRRNFRNKQA